MYLEMEIEGMGRFHWSPRRTRTLESPAIQRDERNSRRAIENVGNVAIYYPLTDSPAVA